MTDAADSREEESGFDDYFEQFASGSDQDVTTADDENQGEYQVAEVEASDDGGQEKIEQDVDIETNQREAELLQKIAELEHAYKSQVGRVSALQKKLDGKREESEEQENNAEDSENPDPEIEGFSKEYPEISNYIDRIVASRTKNVDKEIDKRFAPIQEQEHRRYVESQIAILDKDFPTWKQTISTNEYKDWLASQPTAVQSLMNSDDASDYAYLLKSFDKTSEKSTAADELTQRRQKKLAASEVVQSKGVSNKPIAPDDFEAAWNFYAAKK